MAFPMTDVFSLQKSGLLEVCYRGNKFTICKVAQWSYMAVMVLEDTTDYEDGPSYVTFACWHIDCDFGKKIMENNALFAATMLSKQLGRDPDLVVTVDYDNNPFVAIRNEIQSGVRKPILDPGLDRIFKEQETRQLKVYMDTYGENPQFSPKKVWPGMLMLLLYPLGLPFFYFGKRLWGVIMLVALAASCIVPPMAIAAGLLGCVLIVMLLFHVFGNQAKDKQGLLICTQREQKRIRESIAKYKQNLIDLEADNENT